MPNSEETIDADPASSETNPTKRRKRPLSRFMMLARRTHLYVGLFLLPWVFLYGITGAMYNHQGLFPDVELQLVPTAILQGTAMSQFPAPDVLARQAVDAIDAAADNASVQLAENHGAEFTNQLMFEVHAEGHKQVVRINPLSHQSEIVKFPKQDFKPENLIQDVKNIRLDPNPQDVARRAAQHIFTESGISPGSSVRPHGWTKLNFLATVDGQKARVTYVLKDGHVDVTKYDGQPGMSPRGFFMRLHTTHGQSPGWTARMIWSLFVDTMAIAMVTWGLTGLLMWWQIKRVRLVGAIVIASSAIVAVAMYLAMQHFYASNML